MDNRRNYYRILHVQFDAPEAVIKASYRALMLKLKQHPDLGGDHWNASLINEAYAVLTHPAKRAAYDDVYLRTHGRDDRRGDRRTNREQDAPSESAVEDEEISAEAEATSGFERVNCPFCKQVNLPGADSCQRCAGTLQFVEKAGASSDRRRAIERMPIKSPVAVWGRWPQQKPLQGRVDDFSPLGCRLLLPISLPTGRRIRIAGDLFAAIGSVRSCRAWDEEGKFHQLAVAFLTLDVRCSGGSFVSVDA